MKTTSTFVIGAAMFASTMFAATTQVNEPSTVAFINGDAILENSSIGLGARDQLDAAMATWQERINAASTELDTLTRQRQEQALTLNQAALGRLTQDIDEKTVALERLNDDAGRDLQRLQQQITIDVNAQLGPMVESFAAERGYDVIFDTARLQGILFYSPAKDVTQDFLAVVAAGDPQP